MMINARHVIVDRAGDAKGGGVSGSLMDVLNKRKIRMSPFSENDIDVTAAQFALIGTAQYTGIIALGPTSIESNGGIVSAVLPGEAGLGDTAAVADGLGSTANLCDVRDAVSHDPILDADGRRVYGLFQVQSGVSDGDAIAATAESQVSFVVRGENSTLALTSVTAVVEIAYPKLYAERHVPDFVKSGTTESEVIEPQAVPREPKCRKYVVVAPFTANEVITVATGTGDASGAATPSNDVVTSIGGSAAEFNADNRIRVRVNGQQVTKGGDVLWDSISTLHLVVALDVNDTFEIETAS